MNCLRKDFGRLTEFHFDGRLLRLYQAWPNAKTGAFYRERSIFTFFLQGEAHKQASSETTTLHVGAMGLLRNVDVDGIKISKSGATWLNVELGPQLTERAERLLDQARMDCIRSYNASAVTYAARLLSLLKRPQCLDWDLEELLANLIGRLLVPEGTRRGEELAGDLRDLIDANYGEVISLGEVCKQLGCNASHAGRIFKKRFGCSPGQYLRHVRFSHALQQVLNTDQPLVQIANACGFFDESHLCRVFKQFAKSRPSDCRWLERFQRRI